MSLVEKTTSDDGARALRTARALPHAPSHVRSARAARSGFQEGLDIALALVVDLVTAVVAGLKLTLLTAVRSVARPRERISSRAGRDELQAAKGRV